VEERIAAQRSQQGDGLTGQGRTLVREGWWTKGWETATNRGRTKPSPEERERQKRGDGKRRTERQRSEGVTRSAVSRKRETERERVSEIRELVDSRGKKRKRESPGERKRRGAVAPINATQRERRNNEEREKSAKDFLWRTSVAIGVVWPWCGGSFSEGN
jgi:hypothetical protein